jgi:hypothetical protein
MIPLRKPSSKASTLRKGRVAKQVEMPKRSLARTLIDKANDLESWSQEQSLKLGLDKAEADEAKTSLGKAGPKVSLG